MKIKCDRCGETFDLRDYTMLSSIQMTVSNIGCPQEYEFNLCLSCMKQLNDWLKLNEEKTDSGNKNKWNNMTTQPQSGIAVEIKLDSGEQDIAYRRYGDKRWFLCDNDYVLHNESIIAWRYID